MNPLRLARGLAVVAALAVVATTVVAATTYPRDGDRPSPPASARRQQPLVLRDPATGASFEVPGGGDWSVADRRVRIYYADARGRPAALVRGPAVFRDGYCTARPRGSNRGFAGFTRQDFATWTDALARSDGRGGGRSTGVDRRRVTLADGATGRLWSSGLRVGGDGPCAADGVEVAMVAAGGVRLVLVRDTGEPGTLADDVAEAVLTSLRVPGAG